MLIYDKLWQIDKFYPINQAYFELGSIIIHRRYCLKSMTK